MTGLQPAAMIFPGQGSQHTGMLAELAHSYAQVEQTFAEASEALDYDLWQLVQTGSAEDLALTHITQPAILTSSVALWRVWQAAGGRAPGFMAGHSLGEYSALVCAGALVFREAVSLVRQRGEFMQNAVPVGVGAMAAIIGLEDQAVIDACKAACGAELVAAVNFNAPGQVVIAGHAHAVNLAIENCKAAGAKRALPLAVSAPFHSPLMQPAAERFSAVIQNVSVQAPVIPVLHNVGVEVCQDPAVIRQKLIQQIYHPVPWVASIDALTGQGVTSVIEMGPGKILAGLNRRINKEMKAISVNDLSSLQEALGLNKTEATQ